MRMLIDICHPGHVHLFRNFIFEMKEKGHVIFITVKDIPAAKELLNIYKIPFIEIGSKSDSIIGKMFNQFKYNLRLLGIVRKNNIEIGVGSSISIAHISRFCKIKSIILDDDDLAAEPLFAKFGHPFAHIVLSPDSLRHDRKKKNQIVYPSTHELAYLHPNRFKPDESVLSEIGLKKGDAYFILRFNAFKAHHDIGVKGLNRENKKYLIDMLKKYGKVFITAERDIDPEFKQYQLVIAPEKIHSLIYFSTLFLGDSQTMTTEAAILGTPAIKCNTFAGKLSVPNEMENQWQLCFAYQPEDFSKMLNKIEELLNITNLKNEWGRRLQEFFQNKIELTSFLVWFVENYPESKNSIKDSPEFWNQFKK